MGQDPFRERLTGGKLYQGKGQTINKVAMKQKKIKFFLLAGVITLVGCVMSSCTEEVLESEVLVCGDG